MIHAAGILFTCQGRVLLLQRSEEGDAVGLWGCPGGKIEDGETAPEAAERECIEEIGVCPDGERGMLCRRIDDGVDYTTFAQEVAEPFTPTLNEEHTGFQWADLATLPDGMHPGCFVACRRLVGNETEVAQMIAGGQIASPVRFGTMWLFAMRITGTGIAYRDADQEFVYRPADITLTPEFLARCNGLPVIMEHTTAATLGHEEWADRAVGAIMLPYLKGNEVWGIAKVYHDGAAALMLEERLSTSPNVVFAADSGNKKLMLDDGAVLLVEGKPKLLDHLAICEVGVWDKAGPPAGVDTSSIGAIVADETEKKPEDAKPDAAKPDTAEPTLSDVMAFMTAMQSSMDAKADSLTARMDAWEKKDAKADAAKPDATNEAAGGKEEEAKVPPSKVEADAKKDSVTRADLARVESMIPRMLSAAEEAERSQAQDRADRVAVAFGDSAPRPMQGETTLAYRARLASQRKEHSASWKDVDLTTLPDAALRVAETTIYADAANAALRPVVPLSEGIREIRTRDAAGRQISTFAGDPAYWYRGFTGSMQLAKIDLDRARRA